MNLDEVLGRLDALQPKHRDEAIEKALDATRDLVWVPNPGPQTDAYLCDADELFYGGTAGCGKSDLLAGLALTQHHDSLLLRRIGDDARDLAERGRVIAGAGHSFNGQDKVIRLDDRVVKFSGCPAEADKERFKGRAKDFYGFDEIGDFTETQFRFIKTWNRSTRPGQRCRVVCAGNPPTKAEGLWVVRYWAPWLDRRHPNPAKPGELRWYIRGEGDEDVEVEGPGEYPVGRDTVTAKSRTFIPGKLSDNPDLARTNYGATLDALPEHLRRAYRDGDFGAGLKDDADQLIPTDWVLEAQSRWKPDGWREHMMTAIACDPAGGGADAAEIIARHGGWFASPVTIKGKQTADGSFMAGQIVAHRRNGCPVVIDVGGGYGGSYMLRLGDNNVDAVRFNGASVSTASTQDKAKLKFVNKRAEAYWRMREALDPSQEGGSVIALPPDDELKADLLAPHWELTRHGIKIESKDDIRERIGRSPGKGDSAVMCLAEGDRAIKRAIVGDGYVGRDQGARHGAAPKVIMGHQAVRRR